MVLTAHIRLSSCSCRSLEELRREAFALDIEGRASTSSEWLSCIHIKGSVVYQLAMLLCALWYR